jgi:hypothetical protein
MRTSDPAVLMVGNHAGLQQGSLLLLVMVKCLLVLVLLMLVLWRFLLLLSRIMA